jgi:hypothetical protein
MDNVGTVVDDLLATIAFFRDLGLELEGQATIEGDWAEPVTRLRDMRVEIAVIRVMFAVDDIDETSPGSVSTARSLSAAEWSSTKTRIGSATSADPKDSS